MKIPAKTTVLAACILATALAAALATGVLAQAPFGGRPPAKTAPGRPAAEDPRAVYRDERFIRQLYQGFLSRQPSGDEVRLWIKRMSGGDRPIELVRSFRDKDEYFVREMYLGLLGREPDPEGRETYLRSLRSGRSRADVMEDILRSPEFRRRLR